MTDREILDLLLRRCEDAIDALRCRFSPLIRRISMNILASGRDAEEIESDTYLSVWNTVPPKEPDPLLPYVCRIARNLALDRYRYNHAARRGGGAEVLMSEVGEIVSDTTGAEDEAMGAETASAISDFLRGCTEADRWLFVRRYYFGDAVGDLAKGK